MTRPAAAGGFTLVSAIFLLVVLMVLGISLATLSSVAHTTSAQQIQAARADYAARAGIEWAAHQASLGSCTPSTALSPGGALTGFTVVVACTASAHTVPSVVSGVTSYSQLYYVFDVSATSGLYGGPDFVQRKAQVKMLGPSQT